MQSFGVVVSGLLACNLSSSVPESRDPFQSTVISVNCKTFSGILICVFTQMDVFHYISTFTQRVTNCQLTIFICNNIVRHVKNPLCCEPFPCFSQGRNYFFTARALIQVDKNYYLLTLHKRMSVIPFLTFVTKLSTDGLE